MDFGQQQAEVDLHETVFASAGLDLRDAEQASKVSVIESMSTSAASTALWNSSALLALRRASSRR